MRPKKETRKSAKSAAVTGKAVKGFTDEERVAMKERAQELKAEARQGPRAKKADEEGDVLAMPSKTRNRWDLIRFLDHLDDEIPVVEGQKIVAIWPSASMPSSKPARQRSRREPGTGCPRTPRTAMSSASSKARASSRRDTRRSASATRRTSTKEPCGRSPLR